MEEKIYLRWPEVDSEWIGTLYTWADVAVTKKVEKIFSGGGGGGGLPVIFHKQQPQTPAQIVKKELDSKEYKTFVNLVCKVNGITVHSLKQRKPECKLTLTEINRTIEEVLRPQVKVTYIHKDI
jgi:hypothetical protein